MSGDVVALTVIGAGLAVVVACLAIDSRSVRQRLRNLDGKLARQDLDLADTRDRLTELRAFLSDHANWDVQAPRPAPDRAADRVAQRWNVPSRAPTQPAPPSAR